jgi:prepilin-type processing-associated H-X9-DG protein
MPQSLFIIDLHYLAPLEKLDEAMEAHVLFLDGHYNMEILSLPAERFRAPAE